MYLLLQTSCSSMFYSNSNVLSQIKQGMSPEETTKYWENPNTAAWTTDWRNGSTGKC